MYTRLLSDPARCWALVIAIVIAIGFAPAARADIYKCVDGAAVAYQSMPCAGGAQQTVMEKNAPQIAVQIADAAAAQPREVADATTRPAKPAAASRAPRKSGPWTHETLTLGMSDDEVLNLPAWGRPARVIRKRLQRGWSEEWFYATPTGGEQRLLFVNGKLVDIGSSPVGDTTLYLASAPRITAP
jgi:hypothetical protein